MPALPAASYALTVRISVPLIRFALNRVVNGADVEVSVSAPLMKSSHRTTPMLSHTSTRTRVFPFTVCPCVGEVMETVGGVVSGTLFDTLTEIHVEVRLPDVSSATAISV